MVKISEFEEFLNAEMVKTGDILDILSEGKFLTAEETTFKRPAFQIEVKLPNGSQKTWTMNRTTCRRLASAYGDDSKDWIGRKVRVELLTQNVQGKMTTVIYGHPVETPPKSVSKPKPKLTEEEALKRLEGLDLTDEDREKYLENLRQAGLL